MKKKIISLCLVVVLALTAIGGATLAYFTDTDNADNVFTVGKLDIEQIEQQRKYTTDDDGSKSVSGLEDFTDDKILIPIVGSAQGEKDKYGMPTAANYVDKIVTVKNNGTSDAWVRTFVAIPKTLVDSNGNTAENPLHGNIGNRFDPTGKSSKNDPKNNFVLEWGWDYENYQTFEAAINGITYVVDCFTYKTTLAAGTTSDAVITGYYLDNDVDYDAKTGKYFIWTWPEGTSEEDQEDTPKSAKAYLKDFTDKDGKVHVLVATQAVQAEGFETAQAAFSATFGTPGSDNNPWVNSSGQYYNN